ncbi:MAG: hypothetical protein ACHQUB_02500 [Candidatus Saccharimonadia bacterium]
MRLRVLLSIDFGSLRTDEFIADFTCADQTVLQRQPLDVTFGAAEFFADEIKEIVYADNETFQVSAHIRPDRRSPRDRRKIRAMLLRSGYARSTNYTHVPILG